MLHAVRPFTRYYRMAPFSTSSPPSHGFRRICQALAHGWRTAARYRRLELMSDRELARLGLDRTSIGRHAFFGEQPFARR